MGFRVPPRRRRGRGEWCDTDGGDAEAGGSQGTTKDGDGELREDGGEGSMKSISEATRAKVSSGGRRGGCGS